MNAGIKKEHIEEQIRHYEDLDHQEERKEELKRRLRKEQRRKQTGSRRIMKNAWAEYENEVSQVPE